MTNFTPISALLGGMMIGLSAVLLLYFHGRIAGISGILGGLIPPRPGDMSWRIAFTAGLVAGPLVIGAVTGQLIDFTVTESTPALIAAGLLVGFGTRLGGGCTSGHGVCGIARFSMRSVAATLTFIVTAAATVWLTRHGWGG